VSHYLRAKAGSELVRNQVFLNATANANLVQTVTSSASVDTLSNSNDTAQTFSTSLKPELRHHLGRYADIVSRNVLRYTNIEGRDSSWSRALNIGLRSGQRFSRLGWSVDYTDTNTQYTDRTDSTKKMNSSLSFQLIRQLRLIGNVGYSKSDAPTKRSRNSGTTWTIGADWNPGPRTSLNANFGESYYGNTWAGHFKHTSRRTSITADLSRSLTNTNTLLGVPLDFAVVDASGNLVVDPVTGDPLIETLTLLVPTEDNFINTRAGVTLSIEGRRTTLAARTIYSEREYDVSGEKTKNLHFRLSASRRLSADTSLTANLGVGTYSTSIDTNDDHTYDASLSYSKQLGRRSSVRTNVRHRIHDIDGGGGYTENRIGVSFQYRFD
jgi:uncharacterized protein (PEP-CTERM system associated)